MPNAILTIADNGLGNPRMTTAAPHGLVGGETIVISGNSEAGYNTVWVNIEAPESPTTILLSTGGFDPIPTGTGGTWDFQYVEVDNIAVLPAAPLAWQIDINFVENVTGSAAVLTTPPVWTVEDASGPIPTLVFLADAVDQLELAGEFTGTFAPPLRVVIPVGAVQILSTIGGKRIRPGTYFSPLPPITPPGMTPSGVFRRPEVSRVFRRPEIERVFRRTNFMPGTTIPFDSIPKPVNESVVLVWDFSNFPEIATGGQTITAQTITGLNGAVLSGITVATPALLTTAFGRVPANKGVKALVSGGSVNTKYMLECKATLSGGGFAIVRGSVPVC